MSETEIMKALQERICSNLRVSMPGTIENYDFKNCKASIKIDMQELYSNDTSVDYPVISNVPVIFPRCGGAEITMPVKRGDTCLVIFMDRDINSWLLGASGKKPETRRTHHLNDAVAIMGLKPFSKPSSAENNTDLKISYEGSKIVLKPKGIVEIESTKEINIKTEGVIINCKNAVIKSDEKTFIECQNANIKANENASIECQNANIKASSRINTQAPQFIHKGNLKIEGNIEITGPSLLKGKLETKAGIENSGGNIVSNGKTFETHTHNYDSVESVTSPQGPCNVMKLPKNTGVTI